jgi:hypothetical protein
VREATKKHQQALAETPTHNKAVMAAANGDLAVTFAKVYETVATAIKGMETVHHEALLKAQAIELKRKEMEQQKAQSSKDQELQATRLLIEQQGKDRELEIAERKRVAAEKQAKEAAAKAETQKVADAEKKKKADEATAAAKKQDAADEVAAAAKMVEDAVAANKAAEAAIGEANRLPKPRPKGKASALDWRDVEMKDEDLASFNAACGWEIGDSLTVLQSYVDDNPDYTVTLNWCVEYHSYVLLV